jgi:FkbM family methyltransferase
MLLDLINLKNKYDLKINGVVHIGAHFGEEYPIYEKLKIKNLIFFEPLSSNYRELQKNVGSKAKIFNMALGNVEGEIEMFVESANKGQSSSILEPKLHLEQYPHIVFNQREKVKITKLDNFISELTNINFINIDVQGYELEVFKGALVFLKNVDYIMTEVNNAEVYQNCAKVDELDNFLSEYGFKRVETTWDGRTWGDAFYIKKNGINI